MNLAGSTLGKYQVLEGLGRGGMAVVYKGYNPALDRVVALKVLKEGLAADEEFVKRFRREAKTAADLKHRYIATVYDAEEDEGTHYIVMEYLPGRTLQQEIREQGAPPLDRAVDIARALADALDYAHQRELTHRDVKPSNVMIGPQGQVTLMDFGIVKAAAGIQLTQEGTRIGTPEYMSPEQAQGRGVDHRSDIYSLGVVLYEMLVGRVPFQATSSSTVLQSHVRQPPPPPSKFVAGLSPAVEKVVLRALNKRPRKRFQTAGQLAAALEQAVLPSPKTDGGAPQEARLGLVTADGREFGLAGNVGLGRSSDNQVMIPDVQISRHHAQVRCQGTRCEIADLGSVNGTFVNGQKLRRQVPQLLRPGDQVRLGPRFTMVVDVGTGADRPNGSRSRSGRGCGLVPGLRANGRSCLLVALAAGIFLVVFALVLAVLYGYATYGAEAVTDPAATMSALPPEEVAKLRVLNSTGHALELEIGGHHWDLADGQRRIIRFPAGQHRYTVTLDNGEVTRNRRTWQPGDNGELRLVSEEP